MDASVSGSGKVSIDRPLCSGNMGKYNMKRYKNKGCCLETNLKAKIFYCCFMKFCLTWNNDNLPGASSEADCECPLCSGSEPQCGKR